MREAKTGSGLLIALLHAGFVLTGVVNTMLGPMLPALSVRWALNDAQAGYLFTAQFGGSLLGVMGSSLMSRLGYRISLLPGLIFMALGSAALTAPNWKLGLIAALWFGIGLGLTIPTTNLLISDLHPGKRAAALSLVNCSWGLGAVGCPLLVAGLQRVNRSADFLYGVAAALLFVTASTTQVSFPASGAPALTASASELDASCWRSRFVPILGAIFFLYAGSEAAVGGWSASFAQRIMTGSKTSWAIVPSFFWATLLLGRASAPVALRFLTESKLATFGLALGGIGIVALLKATNLFALAMAVSMAGLGFSSVFPIAIAALSSKFGPMASRIAGLMFGLAALGGATLPWLVGYFSTKLNNLRYGLLVPLFGSIAMLILNVLLSNPAPPNEEHNQAC